MRRAGRGSARTIRWRARTPPLEPGRLPTDHWLTARRFCARRKKCEQTQSSVICKLAALPCGCCASLAGSCWLQGYPNFDCGLEEGAPLTCKAFPLLWPPQAAAAAGYKGLAAERLAPMLTLQPSAGYAKVRQAQASTYSTAAGGGG